MAYNKITLFSPAKYDYLIMTTTTPTGIEIAEHENLNFNPTWSSFNNTEIFCPFTDNLVSTYIESLVTPVISWKIYKQKIGQTTLELICEVPKECLSIMDYKVASNEEVRYFVAPQTIDSLGISLASNYVKSQWEGYSFTPLYEIKPNVFVPKNVWYFPLNAHCSEITRVYDRTKFDNFTKYAKYSIGNRNYTQGSLSCLLGSITKNNQNGFDYYDDVKMLEQLNEDIYSGRQCLYKDIKGNMRIVTIESLSSNINDYVANVMPTSISISWFESSDLDNMSVYSENIEE